MKQVQISSPASRLDFFKVITPNYLLISVEMEVKYLNNLQTNKLFCALGSELKEYFGIPAEPKRFF